jgi:hypothetical protein
MALRTKTVLRFATIFAAAALLVACAAPPTVDGMKAAKNSQLNSTRPAAKFVGGVKVSVSGGKDEAQVSLGLSNPDLQRAVEASLLQSGLVDRIEPGKSARYALNASVANFAHPLIGANFTVRLELAWSMTESGGEKILLRKAIESINTAQFSESFSGANRLRLAIEGAVRKNIESMLQELAATPN